MDAFANPFSPGAGAAPPELVGRGEVLSQTSLLLARVLARKQEKSVIMTGLRGVGKTVLLNQVDRQADARGYRRVVIEATNDRPFPEMLIPELRRTLLELDRIKRVSQKVKVALMALRGFVGTLKVKVYDVTWELPAESMPGLADSGDLQADLGALFVALAEAARDRGTGILLLIDEIQYLSSQDLGALIVAMHRVQQENLPLVLVAGGLPTIAGLAGQAKSYAERLFDYPMIGALSENDCAVALQAPVNAQGVKFEDAVLERIFEFTRGYPYFVQEWGYQCWNAAQGPSITEADAETATSRVMARLDGSFFRVRYDRLTPGEQRFLRAMAELGPGPCKLGDIARTLKVTTQSLSPVRAKVIGKGMVYSPRHGEIAYTVPLFDGFMKRAMPYP